MNREFISLDIFNRLWEDLGLTDDDLKELQEHLNIYPETGKIIKKTGGVRKMIKEKEYKDMTVGEGLISALQQAINYEKGKKVKGVKSTKILIAPLPHYKAQKIKQIRNRVRLSQTAFAHVLGVSKKTVEAWESGRNEPQGPAQRMLMLLEKDNKFLEKYELIIQT